MRSDPWISYDNINSHLKVRRLGMRDTTMLYDETVVFQQIFILPGGGLKQWLELASRLACYKTSYDT